MAFIWEKVKELGKRFLDFLIDRWDKNIVPIKSHADIIVALNADELFRKASEESLNLSIIDFGILKIKKVGNKYHILNLN